MSRLRFFDPASPVFDATCRRHHRRTLAEEPDSGAHRETDGLFAVQREAIQSFQREHVDDAVLLESNRVLGIPVRKLSELTTTHPGNVSRRIGRIEQRLRCHVLAHSLAYLLRVGDGFTLSPTSAMPVPPLNCYAIGLRGLGTKFVTEPSPDECREFLESTWKELLSPEPDATGRDSPTRFVGGWKSAGTCWLDVTVLVSDREEALRRGRLEGQHCIFHLRTRRTLYV